MNLRLAVLVFMMVQAVVVYTLWQSVAGLPPVVASHFGAAGQANGFMPRDAYLGVMAGVGGGIPLLLVLLMGGLPRWMPQWLNLPNRDYWLMPARRQATLDFLLAHSLWFGSGLAAFLGVVNLQVLDANRHQPPQLDAGVMLPALVLFLTWAVGLSLGMFRRFRRP